MTAPPRQPKIYHITHVDNLPCIVADGCLVSDAAMIARGGPTVAIGMSEIKRRRVYDLEVHCHPNTNVGDYVPFFFCPRSIMLYVIHCANHPELKYRGGQGPIVHLEADLYKTVASAEAQARRWAVSLSNAGAVYAQFRARLDQLSEIDWTAVAASDFRAADIKEGKQAEFLLHEFFPWSLVRRIGVHSHAIMTRVTASLATAEHRPSVEVRREWYF